MGFINASFSFILTATVALVGAVLMIAVAYRAVCVLKDQNKK